MSEKQEKDEVLEVIKLVDKEYKDSVLYSALNIETGFMVGFLLLLWAGILVYYSAVRTSIQAVPTILALLISFLALFTTINVHSNNIRKSLLIERNYYFIVRNHAKGVWGDLFWGVKLEKEKENPFLRAVIKMKANNPQLGLEELYQQNKLLFSKEKLLENLLYD